MTKEELEKAAQELQDRIESVQSVEDLDLIEIDEELLDYILDKQGEGEGERD